MNPLAIKALQPAQNTAVVSPLKPAQQGGGDFAKLVDGFSKELNAAETKAETQMADLAAGKLDNVHRVMVDLGKAEVTFNYMMEVRNKVIDAYQEVMRMQL